MFRPLDLCESEVGSKETGLEMVVDTKDEQDIFTDSKIKFSVPAADKRLTIEVIYQTPISTFIIEAKYSMGVSVAQFANHTRSGLKNIQYMFAQQQYEIKVQLTIQARALARAKSYIKQPRQLGSAGRPSNTRV